MIAALRPSLRTILVAGVVCASAPVALACQCGAHAFHVATNPADGRSDVPTNTRIRLLLHVAPTEEPPALACDGADVPVEVVSDGRNGYQQLIEVAPVEELAPGSACVVTWGPDTLSRFTVGAGPDETAPTWDGQNTQDEENHTDGFDCGTWSKAVGVHPVGQEDDVTPASDLLFELQPVGEGFPAWGFVDLFAILIGDGCTSMDPERGSSLPGRFDVRVLDEAGNASPTERMTLDGCGCDAGADAPWSAAVALTLAALWRRRSPRPA